MGTGAGFFFSVNDAIEGHNGLRADWLEEVALWLAEWAWGFHSGFGICGRCGSVVDFLVVVEPKTHGALCPVFVCR